MAYWIFSLPAGLESLLDTFFLYFFAVNNVKIQWKHSTLPPQIVIIIAFKNVSLKITIFFVLGYVTFDLKKAWTKVLMQQLPYAAGVHKHTKHTSSATHSVCLQWHQPLIMEFQSVLGCMKLGWKNKFSGKSAEYIQTRQLDRQLIIENLWHSSGNFWFFLFFPITI